MRYFKLIHNNPPYVVSAIRHRLRFAPLFDRLFLPLLQKWVLFYFRQQANLKLHLGCGNIRLQDYVNIDVVPTQATDLVLNIAHLPFDDNSVAEIYTSHVIEHLPRSEFQAILAHWFHVLQPGGICKIRCPNFELYVREWLEADEDYRWSWGIINLFGHDDRGAAMRHGTGFTSERLWYLLSITGFEVIVCEATETRPFTRSTTEYRPNGDIYCVAVKPNPQATLKFSEGDMIDPIVQNSDS